MDYRSGAVSRMPIFIVMPEVDEISSHTPDPFIHKKYSDEK
jgi:hypothetical protein